MPRPPWLSAQDAYREVSALPPPAQMAADRRDPRPWVGQSTSGDADPASADGPLGDFVSSSDVPQGHLTDTALDWPPAPASLAVEASQHQDVGQLTGRHRLEHERAEINAAEPEAQQPVGLSGNLADIDPDEVGFAGVVQAAEVNTDLADASVVEAADSIPETPPTHRKPLPPATIRVTTMPSEPNRLTPNPDDSLAAQPGAIPARDATAELPHPAQGSEFPPEMSPLPLVPAGYPPGVVVAPPWWPPPGPHVWPLVPPGAPPLSDGQRPWGDVEESLAMSTPTFAPPVRTFRMPPSLDEAKVVDHRKSAPRSGWRRAVHRATRGHVNPGDSRKDRAHQQLIDRIRQPIASDFRIAVLSIKGGVGKTTTTLGLGSALATVRPDRVIAIDANPDRGTLAERVHDASTTSTVRDLLTHPNIGRYADIRGYTRMAVSRLEVLASEQDPAAAEVFDEADYRRTIDILGQYYNVILTDCGTGIMHSAMAGVLDLAHSIVLVSSPAIDAVQSASATLDWLMQHGHSDLVRECHVVLSAARSGSAAVKLDKVYEFFEARCRSIHFVPFDPHLAQGAEVDFAMLRPVTHRAYLGLAGAVAEQFPQSLADSNHA